MSKSNLNKISKKKKEFADGTMTNAAFFGMIRSALRNKGRWYYPIKVCKDRNRVPYTGTNNRRKWMYKCEKCHNMFDAKQVNVHHKVECGTLTSFDDIPGFVKRLFCDSSLLILLCDDCHNEQHDKIKKL